MKIIDTWKTIVVGGQSYEHLMTLAEAKIPEHKHKVGIIRDLKKFFSRPYLASPLKTQQEVELVSADYVGLGFEKRDYEDEEFEKLLADRGLKYCSSEFILHATIQNLNAGEDRQLMPTKDFHRRYNDRQECKNEKISLTAFFMQDQIPWYYNRFWPDFFPGGHGYSEYPMIFQKI